MKDRKYLLEQLRHQEWIQQRLARRAVVNREDREKVAGARPDPRAPAKKPPRAGKPPDRRPGGAAAARPQVRTCDRLAA